MKVIKIKVSIFCLLIVLGSSVLVKKDDRSQSEGQNLLVQNNDHNLGFSNQTGSNTTQAQVITFINFINSGSTFYRNDTEARLAYISDKMNSTYGNNLSGFSVIQMGSGAFYDWSIITYTNFFASVAPGVDRIFPQNSYAFLEGYAYSDYSDGRVYLANLNQKGSGISSYLEGIIKAAIFQVESQFTCHCLAQGVKDALKKTDPSNWNIICSRDAFFAAVYAKDKKYIYTKPNNCYYVFYAV